MEPNIRNRQCRQCGDAIHWSAVRLVGARTFCSESCAITWIAEEASRSAWNLTALRLRRGARGPRHRGRLALAFAQAWVAQRRLDRRLEAGPHAENLPWLWLPPRRAAAGLLLAVVACGLVGGHSPETRAMVSPERRPVTLPRQIALTPPPRPPDFSNLTEPTPPPRLDADRLLVSPPPPFPGAPEVRPHPAVPTPPAAPVLPTSDFTRGNTALREIAFTFDGGSEANVASEILDILQARNVHATFFLTGRFIRTFPDIVRRMVAEGHEVGNHSDTHPHLTTYAQNHRQETLPTVTRDFFVGQLRRADASFRALTGRPMAPYWRAPYGEHNAQIRAWAAEAGYRLISWTRGAGTAEDLDTRDWVADRSSRIYHTRQEIAAQILAFGRGRPEGLNGGVVLMHLNSNRRTDRPHEGLPEVLKTLQAEGYRIVTISEMLAGLRPSSASTAPQPAPEARGRPDAREASPAPRPAAP